MRQLLYTSIYLLLAIILYWQFVEMSVIATNDDINGGNPILEIAFSFVCFIFCVLMNPHLKIPHVRFGFWFVIFLSYIILISLVHGFHIGFQRKIAPFIFVQPLLLFFVEYYAQQDNKIKKLTPYFVLLLSFWLIFVFVITYQRVTKSLSVSYYRSNSSYYYLYFLPMIFLFIKEKFRLLLFLLTLLLIMFSMKRGGLLSLGLGFLLYYYLYDKISRRKRFFSLIILFLILSLSSYFINFIMEGMFFDRFESISDDQGSGRLETWSFVWSNIINSDFYGQLFGHGFNSVIFSKGMDFSAHNDFIEIIYDFGWVGFFLFFVFLFSIINNLLYLVKASSSYAPVLGLSLAIFIMNCFFSHIVIYTECFNLFALYWGALSGMLKRNI